MEGPSKSDPQTAGVIPRMVHFIFDWIYNADASIEFLVRMSMVEIYNEKIRDLLDPSKDNLKIHEDKVRGVFIGDVTEVSVQSEEEIFETIHIGHSNRAVSATNMNEQSSRSHLLLVLSVEQRNTYDQSSKKGKLHLVDLAGSEKVGKTGASGARLDEAKNINKSLSALGNVINALTDGRQSHIPYRDSKLTRILSESLGGNAKTCLIIACSPSSYNEAETLSTLRFGQRAKLIKNAAKVNQERSMEEMKLLLDKAERAIGNYKARVTQLEGELTKSGIALPAWVGGAVKDITPAQPGSTSTTASAVRFAPPGGDDAAYQDLLDDLDLKKVELREKADEVSKLSHDVQELKKMNTSMREEHQKLVNMIADTASERDQLADDKADSKAEIEKLRAQHEMLEAEVTQHKLSIKHLQDENRDMTKRMEQNKRQSAISMLSGDGDLRRSLRTLGVAEGDVMASDPEQFLKVVRQWEHEKVALTQKVENLQAQVDSRGRPGEPGAGESDDREVNKKLSDKVVDLEIQLLEEKEKCADLEQKLKDGDRPLKRKVSQLDKNLEQLTVMYHKLVSQNSGLKVECQVNEKKIQRKEQRIKELDQNLREAKQKYEKLLTQCANLTAAMDVMGRGAVGNVPRRSNVARPIKGGARSGGARLSVMATDQLAGIRELQDPSADG